jgi:hypothetical protein
MEQQKNNIPLPRQSSGVGNQDGDPTATLYGKLDVLNGQVNEIMNDPTVRRMALEVGIVLLAKRYPALSVLLGVFGDTAMKQTVGSSTVRRHTPARKNRQGM